ncbi:MAG TPA: ATP-binding protein, partial [Candidatus Ozemobacteraceae bacterium]|nr:ATP-binding protein [Candidatus Ozemobacteraceae bacterium]
VAGLTAFVYGMFRLLSVGNVDGVWHGLNWIGTGAALVSTERVLELLQGPDWPDKITLREKLGWLAYLTGGIGMVLSWCTTPLPLVLLGWALAGTEPVKVVWRLVVERFTDINADRWVDWFGLLLIILGILFLGLGSIGPLIGLAVNVRANYDSGSGTIALGAGTAAPGAATFNLIPMAVGACFLVLGVGIRRRAMWAGALGLGVTFFMFMQACNSVLVASGGHITHLPRALAGESINLALSWFLFFGFYSIFYPLVSERIKGLAGILEGKLKDADEALKETRGRLEKAAHDAAQAARDLDDERIKFRALFENTNEGIILFDENDIILYMNPAYCSFYEIDRDAWLGKKWPGIFERPGIAVCTDGASIDPDGAQNGSARPRRGEVTITDPRGGIKRRLAFYAKRITNAQGEVIACMGLSRDITLEREIDQMKTEFVSNVSHELRTPLTSIRAYTEMLLDDETDDVQTRRDYLQIVLDEAVRLTNLINDILDLSKMEAGRKAYKFATIGLHGLMKKAASVIAADVQKKGHTLDVRLPDTDKTAICDADLVHQCVLNLLSNAVKYTPEGGRVTLALTYDINNYTIAVTDTGPGISREDQKQLFSKFFRVESTLNRDVGGTGLGLALVRQIAHVHQGEAGVESEPGKGSTFRLTLPYAPVPPVPPEKSAPKKP